MMKLKTVTDHDTITSYSFIMENSSNVDSIPTGLKGGSLGVYNSMVVLLSQAPP